MASEKRMQTTGPVEQTLLLTRDERVLETQDSVLHESVDLVFRPEKYYLLRIYP